MKISPQPLALALLPCLLAACGGGGDDSANNPRDAASTPNNNRPALSARDKQAFEESKAYSQTVEDDEDPDIYRLTAGGATLLESTAENYRMDARSLPSGFTSIPGNYYFPNTNNNEAATVRSYQGFHSGVFIAHTNKAGEYANYAYYGDSTAATQMPVSGKATYSGTAFDRQDRGTLTYRVDFGAKQGEGNIEGLSRYGRITLHPAKIDGNEIEGKASATANKLEYKYDGLFYGNGAEEFTGGLGSDQEAGEYIGFHGTRGDIQ